MLKRILLAFALVLPAFALAQAPEAAKPAAKPAAADQAKGDKAEKAGDPKVQLVTSLGDITIELYPDKAPKSVENFLAYVDAGFYNGTIFHRVISDFMVQGGGFTKDLRQKPTRAAIPIESKNGLSNLRGTVAMARTADPNSATAQFFINTVDNPRLDYTSEDSPGYAVFGKVISGMAVVDKIRAVETGAQGPFRGDVPVTAVVIEKASLLP
ncbi:MAG: peptidyl-prolyl cis-trans isomerase [Xanthomonadales bacterium]|nr:peptidyl-prolyl cis-trans isomerase [Xanthomonadales bacterium]